MAAVYLKLPQNKKCDYDFCPENEHFFAVTFLYIGPLYGDGNPGEENYTQLSLGCDFHMVENLDAQSIIKSVKPPSLGNQLRKSSAPIPQQNIVRIVCPVVQRSGVADCLAA